ncbi:lytic transglycosylase domain-containing protein [Spongorhabdus nitratireducens]
MTVVLCRRSGSSQKTAFVVCLSATFVVFLCFSSFLPGFGAASGSCVAPAPETIHAGDWESMRRGFKLGDHYHGKEVAAYTGAYGQRYFNYVGPQVLLYQSYLNNRVLQTGIPAELALLPLIESGLQGKARSPARAVGFWQFMEGTAKIYGLTIDPHFDARCDFILSTEAAITYLEEMHQRLGCWLLVIAAYNAGEGYIRRALKQAGKNGQRNFWQLKLPAETRQHVARILALSRVIATPERYRVKLPVLESGGIAIFYPDESSSFTELAVAFHCSETLLYQLNPGFRSGQYNPCYQAGLVIPRRTLIR